MCIGVSELLAVAGSLELFYSQAGQALAGCRTLDCTSGICDTTAQAAGVCSPQPS